MFSNCSNLKYLDLSNFDFSNITYMSNMFYNCTNLEFLNFNNTIIKYDTFDKQIFDDLSINFALCTSNEQLMNIDKENCTIIECGEIWRKSKKKLFNDSCYDNCSSISLYEYDYKCNETCPSNTYNNNYICEPCDNNCLSCLNLSYCYTCKEGYHLLFINKSYSYCDISNKGFYYDNSESNYYQCYSTCKTCKEKGDNSKHNCLKYKNEYPIKEIFLNYKNCYNYYNNTKANKIDKSIQNLKFNLFNDFNSSIVGKKINYENEDKNILIELINTYDEKNKDINNETTIDLGDCENILKTENNISNDSILYILKIEVNQTGMKIPKIEYEIYVPSNDSNLIKLDLSVCKETRVELTIPVYINDDIKKYNQSSNYYNDICSKTTSKYGTDICIKDRQNEFIDYNMTLCEENCYLIEYKKETGKVKCSCPIKLNLPIIEDIEIDKYQLLKSFKEINNFANIKLMKCINGVLKLKELKNNFVFFIFL